MIATFYIDPQLTGLDFLHQGDTRRPHSALGYRPAAPEAMQPCGFSGLNPEHQAASTHSRAMPIANEAVVELTREHAEALQMLGSWRKRNSV